ncbi:MAG TPA: PAS domain-containing protein [Thermoflexia bacterium]|nr:PAS domain-containing protein [Thermoflexia bacterium]
MALLSVSHQVPLTAIPLLALVFVPATWALHSLSFRIHRGIYHSFEGPICLACSLLFGPAAAAWVAALGAALNEIVMRRRGAPFVARSWGMFALIWLAGGYAYQAIGGEVPLTRLEALELGRAFFLAFVVAVLNRLVMTLSHRLQGLPALDYLTRTAPRTFLIEMAVMPSGAAMAVAHVYTGPLALTLLILPLLIVGFLAQRLGQAQETLERQVAALDALSRAGMFIGSSQELRPILDLIREGIGQLIDTSNFWVAIYEPEQQELIYEVIYDEGVRYPSVRRPYRPGEGVAAWIIEHRRPLLLHTLEEIQSLGIVLPTGGSGKMAESLLGVPMMVKGKVVGAICTQSYTPFAFTEEDQELLMALANQAAVALENARLFREIERNREYLRTVLDSVDHAIVVTSLDGRVRLVNRAMEVLFGVSEQEAIGRPLTEIVPHASVSEAIQHLMNGESTREETTEIELSDGRVLVAHLTPVTDDRGERIGYVTTMADVSALHQLSELKSRMIRIASHDLRNPLHLAKGFFEVLVEDLKLAGHQEQLASRVMKNLQAMERLIDNLLELERIEATRIARDTPVDMSELVREVVQEHRFRAEMKRLRLWTDIPEEPLLVKGDRHLLTQVVVNLLDNAIKYTPSGGEIWVRLWLEGDEVILTVQDTGIGIPKEAQPYLFEQFYRVHQPGAEKVAGTGLGLSLVQAVVREHGGRVWVESEGVPGKGSLFGVALPAMKQ